MKYCTRTPWIFFLFFFSLYFFKLSDKTVDFALKLYEFLVAKHPKLHIRDISLDVFLWLLR